MGLGYRAISWNPYKRRFDLWLLVSIALHLGLFVGLGSLRHPGATAETLLIRALAVGAFLLLTAILALGPLARLDNRWLPLLYNRRHLGVAMFLLAAAHAGLALLQFHGFGTLDPLVSLLVSNPRTGALAQFPFEWLGLAALAILFLMAASSHDFWLAQWSAPVWKRLHLAVYGAYWLVVLHVALGPLQDDPRPGAWLALALPAAVLAALQLTAAWRERARDREAANPAGGWVPLGDPASIPEGRARVLVAAGERVAVFRDGTRLYALSSVCQHQNGPLGEGRVRGGCAVCPWHGYEYRLESGRSPEPFTESVPQFRLRLAGGQLELDPRPLPPGSSLPALEVPPAQGQPESPFFVGYAEQQDPRLRAAWRRRAAALAGLLLACSASAAVLQPPFADSAFEFGRPRELSGWIGMTPAPHLAVPRPGSQGFSRYLLVAPGKHGAQALAEPFAGRFVSLSASLAHRDGATLLELVPASIRAQAAPADQAVPGDPRDLGPQRLKGEIVDSKCFLGVMKPGELKAHRACASLCIRGGIPPVLCVRREDGSARYWLLVDAAGGAVNQAVLPFVAEPVELEGQGQAWGDLLVLRIDPERIRRL